MKYLILTNHSYMLWQFRRELIQRLLERGEVVISTPYVGHEQDFEQLGCRCIETEFERRSINPLKDLALYRFYKQLLQQECPDQVITYSIKPNVYGGYACRKAGIPYYVNVQGLGTAFQKRGIAQLVTLMYKTALKDARKVFFENRENARLFCRKRLVNKEKVVLLSGAGVNLEHFIYRPYPGEEKGIHFLYLGRIMKEKGVDELFAAFRKLKEQYHEKVVLDLVGFFEDAYKETVDKLVTDGIAVFHGFQEDPRPFYEAAHCVVVPSYHEGMSNVLLEAAATGRALITSDIPGCREAVVKGKNGLLVPPQDSESLFNAMKSFVELSEDERCVMGKNGRKAMERFFDRGGVIERVLEVLH